MYHYLRQVCSGSIWGIREPRRFLRQFEISCNTVLSLFASHLYFCTSKASKVSTLDRFRAAEADRLSRNVGEGDEDLENLVISRIRVVAVLRVVRVVYMVVKAL